MDYIYETMVRQVSLPESRSAVNIAAEYAESLRDCINLTVAAIETLGGDYEILSQSQVVLQGHVFVSFLVRRPKSTPLSTGA